MAFPVRKRTAVAAAGSVSAAISVKMIICPASQPRTNKLSHSLVYLQTVLQSCKALQHLPDVLQMKRPSLGEQAAAQQQWLPNAASALHSQDLALRVRGQLQLNLLLRHVAVDLPAEPCDGGLMKRHSGQLEGAVMRGDKCGLVARHRYLNDGDQFLAFSFSRWTLWTMKGWSATTLLPQKSGELYS